MIINHRTAAKLAPPYLASGNAMLHAHPVKVAGVAVLTLGRQVLAQTGSLSDHQEGDGHEERGDIIRFQQPFVNLR